MAKELSTETKMGGPVGAQTRGVRQGLGLPGEPGTRIVLADGSEPFSGLCWLACPPPALL